MRTDQTGSAVAASSDQICRFGRQLGRVPIRVPTNLGRLTDDTWIASTARDSAWRKRREDNRLPTGYTRSCLVGYKATRYSAAVVDSGGTVQPEWHVTIPRHVWIACRWYSGNWPPSSNGGRMVRWRRSTGRHAKPIVFRTLVPTVGTVGARAGVSRATQVGRG